MFSGLIGQIFAGQPVHRQAEHADTRAELKRREFDDGKSGKKQNHTGQEEEELADDATVSIQSLALFLNNFLASVTEKPLKSFKSAAGAEEEEPPEQATATQPENRPGPNARAANAYQQTAIQSGTARPEPNTAPPAGQTHIGETLSADDIRLIHTILDELKALENKGIEYLHIERSDRFLEGILTAAQKAAQKTGHQTDKA